MKAITVRQPWAELIARGVKTVENRTQMFRYRGPLAIHAGKAVDRDALLIPAVQDAVGAIARARLDLGAVIATCTLVDCHSARPGCCTHDWAERPPPGTRLTHLVLADVLRIRPVFVRGALGLWEWAPPPGSTAGQPP